MIDNTNPPNNKPHDFEEEFDFDSNELFENDPNSLNTVTPNTPSFAERAKWPILIGILITGFLVWKLYGVLFPSTADAQIDKVAAEEAAAINASGTPETPLTPVTPSETVLVTPPATVVTPAPAVVVPSTTLETHSPEEVKHLENTVNQLMDSLAKMDQKISLIGREFFAVSDQVAKLSQEMAQMRNRPAVIASPLVSKPKKPIVVHRPHHPKKVQPVYSVEQSSEEINEDAPKPVVDKHKATSQKSGLVIHAIIPGRVWLKAADGSTFTATIGEIIPGYGKAMVIDAPSASVVTSSGVVLR